MNREISELLDQVDREEGTAEPPAAPADIAAATDYLRAEFDLSLPKIWSDLWLRADGIVCNGMNFYRAGQARETTCFIDSFIDVNRVFKETTDGNFVFYGYGNSVDAFVYHIPSRQWQTVDPIGLDYPYEIYATPEEQIINVLKKYLEM